MRPRSTEGRATAANERNGEMTSFRLGGLGSRGTRHLDDPALSRAAHSHFRRGLRVALNLVATAVALVPAAAQSDARSADTAWETIAPGELTGCADGSSYEFYVRRGDPARLYIHFDGGGACWSLLTCDPSSDSVTYRTRINPAEHPSTRRGYFEERPDNPFQGFTRVHVSYCTGDHHLGTERGGGNGIDGRAIHHIGARNAAAVLRWMGGALAEPATVVVGGSSAGALGAAYYLPAVARMWPAARLFLLSDAAGGTGTLPVLGMGNRWRAAEITSIRCPGVGPGPPTHRAVLALAACEVPDAVIVTLDRRDDQVIRLLLRLVGRTPPRPERLLQDDLQSLRTAVPRLRSFVAEGDEHGLLDQPFLYAAATEQTRLTVWLRDLLATGTAVDAICERCR